MAWETQTSEMKAGASQGAPSLSKIPPPPVEVVIRTMASDIKALSQSGGAGRPQGTSMKLNAPAEAGASSSGMLQPVLIIGGLLVLAAAIYFSFFY